MKNNKKTSTKIALICFSLAVMSLVFPVQINAATVGYGTALGSFLLADGSTPVSAGGISIGFFTGSALPTKVQLNAITSNPYSALVSSYNYVDLRNLADSNAILASFQSSGSWDFSSGWAGATLNVPTTPSNYTTAINGNDALAAFAGGTGGTATTLWAFAFNGGNYANQFSGSTQWAAVTATELGATVNDWLYPTSSETIQLSQINTAGEVLIGTDSGNNVLMANVIPEPSSASLLALGVAGLVALRARRKS
jgi:hypothetical protein